MTVVTARTSEGLGIKNTEGFLLETSMADYEELCSNELPIIHLLTVSTGTLRSPEIQVAAASHIK
jgi:hypothetical protein